jgi:hypothetical protein
MKDNGKDNSLNEQPRDWSQMSWQERREARFQRWLNPPNAKFLNPEAEQLYKARVTRLIKAIKLEEPDRVPVMLPVGNFPAYYGGADFHTVMYDYDALRSTWMKFMDNFGDMDTFMGPGRIPPGRILDAIDSHVSKHPGHGLPESASMTQIVEGEYMFADEYDDYLLDPSDYHIRVNLPRTAGLFESFKKLPPVRSLQGIGWVVALSNPEVRKTFQTILDLGAEYERHQAVVREVSAIALSRGYTQFRGGAGFMAGAPFDHFADLLRGTKGISRDMFRQPAKLHEAMEHYLKMSIQRLKNVPNTGCPVVMMPLHKGDDTFMSDKQFEEFYWPYLRRLFLAMIEEGLVPMPFAEGKYTKRLKQIADTPKSGVMWYFDQTDMAEAKKTIGDICCLVGNVPTSVVMKGTVEQVRENCRQLIETCAPGGGYILAGGASIDTGKLENLKAMMETACEFGIY